VPHNLSAGWIGGLSPFMVTLLSVQAGDALAGLWYPVGMLILASVVGLLFLPETRDVSFATLKPEAPLVREPPVGADSGQSSLRALSS